MHSGLWQLEQRRAVSPISLFLVHSDGSGPPKKGSQEDNVQTGYEVMISDILQFVVLMIMFREETVLAFSNWHIIEPAF